MCIKKIIYCIILLIVPLQSFAQTHEFKFSKLPFDRSTIAEESMRNERILLGNDKYSIVIDPRNGRNLFGTLPIGVLNTFDETDSAFWIRSRMSLGEEQSAGVDRIDKVRFSGDTLFSFTLPDTTYGSILLFHKNKPYFLVQRDSYTIELYDVLNKAKIGSYSQKMPDPWELITSYEISQDMTRLFVKYCYNSISFDVRTGDSLGNVNKNCIVSADGKYIFVRNSQDVQLEVYRASDTSLYYIWKGQKFIYPIYYMKNPESIFLGGVVFNYLDTLNKPDFSKCFRGGFVEPDGELLFYDYHENLFRKPLLDFYDKNYQYLYSTNAGCPDGAFSLDGGKFYCKGEYFNGDIDSETGYNTLRSIDEKYVAYVNSSHYRPRAVVGEPMNGIPYTIKIFDLQKDSVLLTPLSVFHNNAFLSELNDTIVFDDTTGRITTIGFGNEPTISSFKTNDALLNISHDAKILLCSKNRIRHYYADSTIDTLVLMPNRLHEKSEEFEIPIRHKHTEFSPDSKYLVILDYQSRLLVRSIDSPDQQSQITVPGASLVSFEFTPDGKFLLCGTETGKVFVLRFSDGRVVFSMDDMKEVPVTRIRVSSNMKYVAAISKNAALTVWKTNFDLVHAYEPQPIPSQSAVVSIVPNPTSDCLTVSIGNAPAGVVSFVVFDIFGNEALSANTATGGDVCSIESNTSRLPVGTYFYRVLVNSVVVASGSFVVQR